MPLVLKHWYRWAGDGASTSSPARTFCWRRIGCASRTGDCSSTRRISTATSGRRCPKATIRRSSPGRRTTRCLAAGRDGLERAPDPCGDVRSHHPLRALRRRLLPGRRSPARRRSRSFHPWPLRRGVGAGRTQLHAGGGAFMIAIRDVPDRRATEQRHLDRRQAAGTAAVPPLVPRYRVVVCRVLDDAQALAKSRIKCVRQEVQFSALSLEPAILGG